MKIKNIKMKLNWKRRSTYLVTALLFDSLIGIILLIIFASKIVLIPGAIGFAVLPASVFTIQLMIFALIMKIKPSIKKWWFDMEI